MKSFLNITDHKCIGSIWLELCLGLSLILLVLYISLPSLADLQGRRHLKIEVAIVARSLTSIALKAQLEEQTYKLEAFGTKFSFANETNVVTNSFTLTKGITLAGKNPISVVFYKSGVVTPTKFLINSITDSCTITISLRGRVKSLC